MTQTDDTCRGERPSGVRPPGAGRIAARRRRVSSDAVVSAYIRDIARPYDDGNQRDPTPPSSPPPPLSVARDRVPPRPRDLAPAQTPRHRLPTALIGGGYA